MKESPIQAKAKPGGAAEDAPWERILDDFLEQRPILREEKQAGVVLSREHDKRGFASWTKVYENRPGSDSLSVFNEWEKMLIERLRSAGVEKCYRLVESSTIATELDQPSRTTLRTRHVGPDLNRLCRRWDAQRKAWRHLALWADGKPVAHPFTAPANYLRLAQAALEALEQLHQKSEGFVHCDLNPGNLALAVKAERIDTPRGEALRLTPDWDKLVLIDFGYSLCHAMRPLTMLPLDPSSARLSEHLRDCLNRVDAAGQRHFRLRWAEKRYDKSAWSHWRDNPLACFSDIDWREDIHQLGFLLRDIRDDWGGGEHVEASRNHPAMNALIWGDSDGEPGLAEAMMAYGRAEQVGKPAPAMPHRAWIQAIAAALAQAAKADGFAQLLLYRADHDAAYARQWERGKQRRMAWRKPAYAVLMAGAMWLGGQQVMAWRESHQPPPGRAEYEAIKESAEFRQWWGQGTGLPPASFKHWRELGLQLAGQGDTEAALEQAAVAWDDAGVTPDRAAALQLLQSHRAGLQTLVEKGASGWREAARQALDKLDGRQTAND